MYLKFDRHEEQKAMGNASTDKTKLPESGVLSAIQLDFRCTNTSTIATILKQRLIDHITKIELTDGGTDVMLSLTGQELKALDFYHLGQVPPEYGAFKDLVVQNSTVLIPFGEKLGDPKRGLDLGAWDEVDLEITNDYVVADMIDKNLNVDIQLISMQDLPTPPTGYYKHYEWRSEKPSADGQYVRHQLPTNDRIRRYFVQVDPDLTTNRAMTHDPFGSANKFDFSFKERTQYVFKGARPRDVARFNAAIYGRPRTSAHYLQSITQNFDFAIAYPETLQCANMGQSAWSAGSVTLENSDSRMQITRGVTTGSDQVDILATGLGYYHTFVPYDALSGDEMLFLDPAKTAGGKGAVYADWKAEYDDHTFRSILTVPKKQGET